MYSIGEYLTQVDENQDLWFRAEMTYRQFASVANKMESADIENEILNLDYFLHDLKKAQNLDLNEVEKWLKNSWNSENVLHQNKIIIENTGQSFSMQWAFPQAYYSAFTSLLAHYKALGYTQESHTNVLKHFSTLVEQGKLPEGLSFFCNGFKNNLTYTNISKPTGLNAIDFDLSRPETIDNQICQFLKSTREIKLAEKAPDFKFKNKKGQNRKAFTQSMWTKVSNSIGNTTIMDLLYRKRIKANYQDIETFSSNQFKGLEVLESLCTIIDRLNLVNECYIAKAIGIDKYKVMLDRHLSKVSNEIVKKRFETIKVLINSIPTGSS